MILHKYLKESCVSLFQQYTQTTTAFIAIQTTPIPMLSETTIRTQDGDINIEREARRWLYGGKQDKLDLAFNNVKPKDR